MSSLARQQCRKVIGNMTGYNPYNQYRQTQIMTAPPEQLTLMLYDGAIRFCLQAQEQITAKDVAGANNSLVRVQDIISELMLGVNQGAGEIAVQLTLLYDFLYRRAVDANIKKDVAIIDEILGLVRDMRSTWAEAILLARQQQARAGVGDANF